MLPSGIPNLVVNGSSGIAVGMATNIPPHNLREVIAAVVHLIDNPDATPAEIRKLIKGPDFPTGGYIYGREGIKDYQETGRGRIVMRARAVIEEKESSSKSQIVVTEIPYQVNKARLVEQIAELVKRQEARGDQRICATSPTATACASSIELKRDAIPRVVLNQLYKHTTMQATFGVIMLALVPDAADGAARAEGDVAQGDARALHRAPARGDRPPHAVRPRQGARARAHPRRAQDRRRQHRRGDQAHSRGGGHAARRARSCRRGSSCRSVRPRRSSTCASRS